MNSELDSYANTSVAGMDYSITHDCGKQVNVTSYDPTQDMVQKTKVGSTVLAYNYFYHTGDVWIIKYN